MKQIIAHRDIVENEWLEQSLDDHLINAAMRAYSLGSSIGIACICLLAALFHDTGKSTRIFQNYIRGKYKGRVTHSTQGAVWVFHHIQAMKSSNLDPNILHALRDSIIYPIMAHHGLMDIVVINDDTYYSAVRRRLQYSIDNPEEQDEVNKYIEHLIALIEVKLGLSIEQIFSQAYDETKAIIAKIEQLTSDDPETGEKERAFYHGAFIRLILSIIKEADIYDSANAFAPEMQKLYSQEETEQIWLEGLQHVESQANSFEECAKPGTLNAVRCDLSAQSKEKALTSDVGIYRLDLPTGAGKTQTVLRYSLNHAHTHKMQRIVYLAPFLSVLEQNAKAIRSVLDQDQHVLEHHSNIIDSEYKDQYSRESEDDLKQSNPREYLVDSWETPYLLTTLVQFSNTLFSGRSASIRRFSKLTKSMIIMDEIQSLPLKAIYPFNLMTNFLSKIMKATIIHCTATPPYFDHEFVQHPISYGAATKSEKSETNITNIAEEDEHHFDRVIYKSLLGEDADTRMSVTSLIDHLDEQLSEFNSALIVCNTKKTAQAIYQNLHSSSYYEVYFLTTDLCAEHRLNIIHKIKERLLESRQVVSPEEADKIVCISTQLIEAGVDLDFDICYRAAAGVDRIVQTAGRCNREGKVHRGYCYIFWLSEESLTYLPEIKATQDALIASLYDIKSEEIDVDELLLNYFNRYYVEHSLAMSYPVKRVGSSILEMLSTNTRFVEGVQTVHVRAAKSTTWSTYLRQHFKTAAEAFELIERRDTVPVIVQYKNDDLIEQLYLAEEKNNYIEAKKLLKFFNRHTIQLTRAFIEEHSSIFIPLFDGAILILDKKEYSESQGFQRTNELELLIT